MRYWLLLMVATLGVDAYAVASGRAGDATAISLIALAVALFAYFMVAEADAKTEEQP